MTLPWLRTEQARKRPRSVVVAGISIGNPATRRALARMDASIYTFVEARLPAMAETQISTYISESTKEQLEQYAEAHGVKKGYLVEQALLHHLHALRELPADIVIPPRITVALASFEAVTDLIRKPRKPTRALRDMLAGKPVDDEL